ncbi:hypothetical protein GGI42DRAFT_149288 [Trichoderma sp. SZMC 28013]
MLANLMSCEGMGVYRGKDAGSTNGIEKRLCRQSMKFDHARCLSAASCFGRLIIAVLVIAVTHEREAVPMDAKYLGRTTKLAGPKKATLTMVPSEATTGPGRMILITTRAMPGCKSSEGGLMSHMPGAALLVRSFATTTTATTYGDTTRSII